MSGKVLQFGSPKGGWPTFNKEGRKLSDEQGYIAGPMRGYPLYNFPAFARGLEIATEKLPTIKWISPAQMDLDSGFDPADPADFTSEAYYAAMRRDFAVLLDPSTKHILLLPAWEKSEGAFAESTVGGNLGHKFYEIGCLKSGDIYPLEYGEVKSRLIDYRCMLDDN